MKTTWRHIGIQAAGWGRTLAWLAAAALLARTAFWLYGWLSPCGAVATIYRGEAFQKARWICCLRRLEYGCEGRPAPFVSRDRYSMRIKARLYVPKTAVYDFATLSDDGIRIRIDGQPLIDNWREQDFYRSGRSASRELSAGFHELGVEFCNFRGAARFRVEWCGGPIPPRTVLGPPYLCKPPWKDRW